MRNFSGLLYREIEMAIEPNTYSIVHITIRLKKKIKVLIVITTIHSNIQFTSQDPSCPSHYTHIYIRSILSILIRRIYLKSNFILENGVN